MLFPSSAALVKILESVSIATDWCLKMALEGLGAAGHNLILAPRLWHSLQKIYRGVEFFAVKTKHSLSLFLILSW